MFITAAVSEIHELKQNKKGHPYNYTQYYCTVGYIMCACIYIPFIMHWLRLVVVLQEIQRLLSFHYDVGCQGIEMYPCVKFCLPQCFPLSVTCTYICH